MGQRARPKSGDLEDFRFAIEEGSFDYGLHLNDRPIGPLGVCWETHAFTFRAPVRNKTKRRVERVELRVYARDFDPDHWKPEWKAIGSVSSVRHGNLDALVHLPLGALHSFHTLLMGIMAGKVKGADIAARPTGRRLDFIRSFYSVDPDDTD